MATKLPFGSKFGLGIFYLVTQSVRRVLPKKVNSSGATCIVYLGEFLVIFSTHQISQRTQAALIFLHRKLGFEISWEKWIDATQCLLYLGIQLN